MTALIQAAATATGFPLPSNGARAQAGVFPVDAALAQQGLARYSTRRVPFAEVLAAWRAVIAGEMLSDVKIAAPFEAFIDWRDGAFRRNAAGGGACYTPHAWAQLVNLFRVGKGNVIPSETVPADRWHSPVTRHFGFEDVKRASKRARQGEEIVLRMFRVAVGGRYYPAIRAAVSGRHGLKDFDDSAVIEVLEGLTRQPTEGRISRGWDKTYGSFMLDSGDADVRLGFGFTNSETGRGSLTFEGSISIKAFDSEVLMPSGAKYERIVQLASDRAATKRRHVLPRYDTQTGNRFTDAQRTAIARGRIGRDVETALAGAEVLAERWEKAREEIHPQAVTLSRIAAADDFGVKVLTDALLELGCADMVERGAEFLKELATVIADDARLRSLPHGSAAHMAAALAVLAVTGDRTWEDTRELQALAGQFVMEGWAR